MEPLKKEKMGKLEKILVAAHGNREQSEPGDAWEMSVMNSVRKIPTVSERFAWSEFFDSFFWQFCPVACAIIIFLAVAIFSYDIIADKDYALIFMDESIEVTALDPYSG
jgi:hypothetical protein